MFKYFNLFACILKWYLKYQHYQLYWSSDHFLIAKKRSPTRYLFLLLTAFTILTSTFFMYFFFDNIVVFLFSNWLWMIIQLNTIWFPQSYLYYYTLSCRIYKFRRNKIFICYYFHDVWSICFNVIIYFFLITIKKTLMHIYCNTFI